MKIRNLNIFILLTLLALSCKKGSNNDVDFGFIDYSYTDGWTMVQSVLIDSLGNTYLEREDKKGKSKYHFQIDRNKLFVLDSLLTQIRKDKINTQPADTIIKNLVDSECYSLLIEYKDSDSTNIKIEGREPTKEEKRAYPLFRHLNNLINTKIQDLNQKKFKTKSNYFIFPVLLN